MACGHVRVYMYMYSCNSETYIQTTHKVLYVCNSERTSKRGSGGFRIVPQGSGGSVTEKSKENKQGQAVLAGAVLCKY